MAGLTDSGFESPTFSQIKDEIEQDYKTIL